MDVHRYQLARRYMPLGWLSYAWIRILWSLNPKVYHVGKLLPCTGPIPPALFFVENGSWVGHQRQEKARRSVLPLSVWCGAVGALFWRSIRCGVEAFALASSRI